MLGPIWGRVVDSNQSCVEFRVKVYRPALRHPFRVIFFFNHRAADEPVGHFWAVTLIYACPDTRVRIACQVHEDRNVVHPDFVDYPER